MSANLLYTEVEEDLRATVGDLLADRADTAGTLRRLESEQPVDLDLWRALATDLGVTALHVPESLGGQGASLRETAVVLEELGRSVAAVPYLTSAVVATSTLLGCERGDEVSDLLTEVAKGEQIAVLGVPLTACTGDYAPALRCGADGVVGELRSVADAQVADVVLLPVTGRDGPELHAVRVADGGVTVTPVVSLDMTRPLADLRFEGAPSVRLASAVRTPTAVDDALLTGAGLLASEQAGIAQWCLDTTVAYLKQRYQFGRPLGSFQALKHRLADLFGEIALARAAARAAADALATGEQEVRIAVGVAQSLCAEVAVHAAEECVQLHGGIGMTWEHPAHLYLKRAKADQLALGTPGRHRAILAGLVGLPAS